MEKKPFSSRWKMPNSSVSESWLLSLHCFLVVQKCFFFFKCPSYFKGYPFLTDLALLAALRSSPMLLETVWNNLRLAVPPGYFSLLRLLTSCVVLFCGCLLRWVNPFTCFRITLPDFMLFFVSHTSLLYLQVCPSLKHVSGYSSVLLLKYLHCNFTPAAWDLTN